MVKKIKIDNFVFEYDNEDNIIGVITDSPEEIKFICKPDNCLYNFLGIDSPLTSSPSSSEEV